MAAALSLLSLEHVWVPRLDTDEDAMLSQMEAELKLQVRARPPLRRTHTDRKLIYFRVAATKCPALCAQLEDIRNQPAPPLIGASEKSTTNRGVAPSDEDVRPAPHLRLRLRLATVHASRTTPHACTCLPPPTSGGLLCLLSFSSVPRMNLVHRPTTRQGRDGPYPTGEGCFAPLLSS